MEGIKGEEEEKFVMREEIHVYFTWSQILLLFLYILMNLSNYE